MKFKSDQTTQKLRGGYYTPQNLADYATKWVYRSNQSLDPEPSCGDGVFINALHNNNCDKAIKISCFELFDTEAKTTNLCTELDFKNATITEGDFLVWANKQLFNSQGLFDSVIGNPPFIRYQFLEKSFQEQTELVYSNS